MTTFPDLAPGSYTVDPTHTTIGFTARHMMVAKVRGTFTDYTAQVQVGQSWADTSVRAEVQLASVDTRNADRDTHLRSADFFDTDVNPTMTFVSTEVSADSMTGDLTIKGVTRPVTFDLEFVGTSADPWGGRRAGFEASTTINRKDFGLTWNVAVEGGGVLVGEKVQITLDVELVAPSTEVEEPAAGSGELAEQQA